MRRSDAGPRCSAARGSCPRMRSGPAGAAGRRLVAYRVDGETAATAGLLGPWWSPPGPPSATGSLPAPARELIEPGDLAAGDVRQVWASTVCGVGMNWIAPVPQTIQDALGAPGGRGRAVRRRHVGLGRAPRRGHQARRSPARGRWRSFSSAWAPPTPRLDGAGHRRSRLWSGLDSQDGRPGAVLGRQAEFREEGTRLRLVVFDGGRHEVLRFRREPFRGRPLSPRPPARCAIWLTGTPLRDNPVLWLSSRSDAHGS